MRNSADAVGDHLQSGHVGAGEAGAAEELKQHGGPDAGGKQAEARGGDEREGRRYQPHVTGVVPVGEADEERHRHHVAAEIGAADPAGCRVRQRPRILQVWLQRQEHRKGSHAEDLGEADDEHDAARGGPRRRIRDQRTSVWAGRARWRQCHFGEWRRVEGRADALRIARTPAGATDLLRSPFWAA